MRKLLVISLIFSVFILFSFCKVKKETNFKNKISEIEIKERPSNPRLAVNDFAKIFSNNEFNILEQKLRKYYDTTSNEIVIISLSEIDSTQQIAAYGLGYGKKWKVGSAEKDNGVILLISLKPRKIRIEVGKGLEDCLSNEKCSKILSETMIPKLKENKMYEAFDLVINEIQKSIGNKFKMD